MSVGFKEQIILALQAALEYIQIDNGYNYNVGRVTRMPVDDETESHPFVLELSDLERETFGAELGNLQQVTLSPTIIAYVTDVVDLESTKVAFHADLKRRLHELDPQKRGSGNAWSATLRDYVKYVGILQPDSLADVADDSEAIFTQPIEIIYYYPKDNP